MGHRVPVICVRCGWKGRRVWPACECYDEWATACRPWSPGPGCLGRWAACPKCGDQVIDASLFSEAQKADGQ